MTIWVRGVKRNPVHYACKDVAEANRIAAEMIAAGFARVSMMRWY